MANKTALIVSAHSADFVWRCGGAIASRILLGGESLDGEEAHRMQLAHRLVPSELVWANANEWAKQIAHGAAESVQLTKRLVNEMIGESLLTHLASGAAVMATACRPHSCPAVCRR